MADDRVDVKDIIAPVRELSATLHPDRGGDTIAFAQLTQAYHEALGASR